MASSINVAVELAEPNCNGEGAVEILKPLPFSTQNCLRNGDEGVVATKNDCGVGDGLLPRAT